MKIKLSNLGDEFKMANGVKSKVIALSLKDRTAVLIAGRMADAAYWWMGTSKDSPAAPGTRAPYADDVLEQPAETALRSEHLGKSSVPDVLAVSFSANDILGHRVGPDSPEVEDMCVKTDDATGG
jgi:hypothetical protein